MEGIENQINMSYNDLCMFPDIHLLVGFKMPKINLYDGRGYPVAHLRGYCSEMRSVSGKDELLMEYFSESLSGEALEWYTRQDVSKWYAWDDMAQDFVRHFQYNIDIIPDRSSLSKMEKKLEESFREFGSEGGNKLLGSVPRLMKNKWLSFSYKLRDPSTSVI
nr:uncharacterized protein LOC117281651 [Nicotiana tomentosiformis]